MTDTTAAEIAGIKVGDRVHTKLTRNSYEHDATVVAIRTYAVKSIGVRLDDYESDIAWWYEPCDLVLLESRDVITMDTTNTAAEIARQLSAGERKCLAFDNLNSLSTAMFTQLFYKGLIYKRIEGDKLLYERTELGRNVLAVLAALQPAPAGEAGKPVAAGADWKSAAECSNNLYLTEKERYNELYQQYVDAQQEQDDLVSATLFLLGVSPSDWVGGIHGIESAVKSNLRIGEPNMSKIDDWTDTELNKGSITEGMFKLLERAQKAEAENAALRATVSGMREAMEYIREKVEKGHWYDLEEIVAKALAAADAEMGES